MLEWLAIVFIVFPAAMILAACFDFFTMTIPNRLTLALAVAFFVAAPVAGLSLHEFGLHVAAGAAMLAIAFGLFSLGWIGGGDAKLFAATALWLGWEHLLAYAFLFSLLGGGLTLMLLMVRRFPLPSLLGKSSWALRLHDPKSGVPYGIALATAGLMVFPSTGWMAV